MTPVENVIIQTGKAHAQFFNEDCVSGDTRSQSVGFFPGFPGDGIRVIVTPTNLDVAKDEYNAAVVGIAQNVSAQGFTLLARNSDCKAGATNFYWMAVQEHPLGLQEDAV